MAAQSASGRAAPALVALPLAIPADAAPPAGTSPALRLLRTLVLVIGLPFAVVATTGPLLQRWYSWGESHRCDDPYSAFAASNLDSSGGLLAYPTLIEPHLALDAQRAWWSAAFFVFIVLTATCALSVRRGPQQGVATERHRAVPAVAVPRPDRRQVLSGPASGSCPRP